MRAYYCATVLLINCRALIVVMFGGKGGNLSNGSCTASSGRSKRKHKKELGEKSPSSQQRWHPKNPFWKFGWILRCLHTYYSNDIDLPFLVMPLRRHTNTAIQTNILLSESSGVLILITGTDLDNRISFFTAPISMQSDIISVNINHQSQSKTTSHQTSLAVHWNAVVNWHWEASVNTRETNPLYYREKD